SRGWLSALVGLPIGAAGAPANKPLVDAPAAESNAPSRQGMELSATAAPKGKAAEAWDAVKDTTNPALLEAFVRRYRNTFFAVIAMARLARTQGSRGRQDAVRTAPGVT